MQRRLDPKGLAVNYAIERDDKLNRYPRASIKADPIGEQLRRFRVDRDVMRGERGAGMVPAEGEPVI